MTRPPVRMASLLAALMLSLTACGDAGEQPDLGSAGLDETTSTTDIAEQAEDVEREAEEVEADEVEAEEVESDEVEAGAPAADVVISGSFSRGEIQIEDRRFDVPVGSSVLITFESDEVEHIHLHGYDLLADLVPGEPAEIAFVADSPGTFEVELEDSGRFLFELLVR